MAISEWIEKLGRAIFEAPLGSAHSSNEAPELAEIRLAVLDEVKARSHRVGGRNVFPHNVVKVRLRGVPPTKAATFTGKFFHEFCEQELRAGLTRSHYHFPDELQVEVETTPGLPEVDGRWLEVSAESRLAPAPAAQTKRPARIVVAKGTANPQELTLSKARTNIGRTLDVYRTAGPSRRNDVAFDETDELSKTVSREHAHITYSKKTGEYRLINDRSYTDVCGLWVIRDGLSLEVHRGARGVRLEPGDEIHLGRAVVKFK